MSSSPCRTGDNVVSVVGINNLENEFESGELIEHRAGYLHDRCMLVKRWIFTLNLPLKSQATQRGMTELVAH